MHLYRGAPRRLSGWGTGHDASVVGPPRRDTEASESMCPDSLGRQDVAVEPSPALGTL